MRSSFLGAVFLLGSAAVGAGGLAPAFADEMAAGRIRIEYSEPTNPDHQILLAQLKARRALEDLQAIFMPFRLPRDVTLRTVGCNGVANAWYQVVDGQPTVSLCYEYLYDLWERLPTMAMEGGVTPTDALMGQLFFTVSHEIGHLLFDVFKVPIFGREEDAADQFATYMMLQFGEGAYRLIMGAAWSYRAFIMDYRGNPKAILPLAAFSSTHSQPEERFYNMMCVAYGSDGKRFAGLVEKGLLPASRAGNCNYEFEVLQFAFQQGIAPHLDEAMAAKVLAMDWLAAAIPPRPIR